MVPFIHVQINTVLRPRHKMKQASSALVVKNIEDIVFKEEVSFILESKHMIFFI